MSMSMLNAVPIVEASSDEEDRKQLVDVCDFNSYTWTIYKELCQLIWCVAGAGETPESGWDVLGEWPEGMSLSHVAVLVAVKRTGVRRENPKNTLVRPWHVNTWEGARDMSRDIHLGPSDPYCHGLIPPE